MGSVEEIAIPKKCIAGVCVDEGPDFKLQVEEVDVPEPGIRNIAFSLYIISHELIGTVRSWPTVA